MHLNAHSTLCSIFKANASMKPVSIKCTHREYTKCVHVVHFARAFDSSEQFFSLAWSSSLSNNTRGIDETVTTTAVAAAAKAQDRVKVKYNNIPNEDDEF